MKVNSHIDRIEAPNERFCDLNDSADQLATSARDKVTQGEMEAREPCMLPHSRITCWIDNKMTTNDRDKRIRDTSTGESLKQYLCDKHGWSNAEFAAIDWKSYTIALSKFKKSQRSTLLKYLHGWLATNDRQKSRAECR